MIGVLVALLLPSLSRVRFQARLIACRANLHDLGVGFTVYAENSRGYFPITPEAGADTFYAVWNARLLPDPKILTCPATKNIIRVETLSWPERYDEKDAFGVVIPYRGLGKDEADRSDLEHVAFGGPQDGRGGGSYEYNGCYDSGHSPFSKAHKRSTTFVFPPHEMMLVHDADNDFRRSTAGCRGSLYGGNNCPQPWDNHGADGMNMMFADGHAEWVRKVPGVFRNVREGGLMRKSENASIDRVQLKSQYPWEYKQQ